MNIKRLVTSFGMLAFVGAVVVGGTGAFFSDTEVSQNNVFTAGEVKINLAEVTHEYLAGDGEYDDDVNGFEYDTGYGNFSFADLKPLDWGRLTTTITNVDNEAYVCGYISDADVTGGENLYDFTQFYAGDEQLVPGSWVSLGTAPATGGTLPVEVDYCFGAPELDGDGNMIGCDYDPSVDYNLAQDESFSADLLFYAIQTRNNGDFSCDQLTLVGGEPVYTPVELPAVGASLGAYASPLGSCDVTVGATGEYNSIQAAIDTEGANTVICVDDDYNENDFDNGPIRINQNNITLAALTQGVAIGEPVVIDNDGATVTGFTGTAGPVLGSNAAFYVNNGVDNYTITFNSVDDGTNGVETSIAGTSNGLVANNVFSNLTRGIYYNLSTDVDTELNTFENNTVGIANSSPQGNEIRLNNFVGNSEAIGYDESLATGSEDLSINQNNFNDGEVNNYSTGTVDATNNWWGGDGSADNLNIPASASGPITTAPEQATAFPIN